MCDTTLDIQKLVPGDKAKVIDAGGFDLNRWLKNRTVLILSPKDFQDDSIKITGCKGVERADLLEPDCEYLLAQVEETGDIGIIRQAGSRSIRYQNPAQYEIIEKELPDIKPEFRAAQHVVPMGGTQIEIPKKYQNVQILMAALPIVEYFTSGPVTVAKYYGFDGKLHIRKIRCQANNVQDVELGKEILFYKILQKEARRYRENVLYKKIVDCPVPALTAHSVTAVEIDTCAAPLTPITEATFLGIDGPHSVKDGFGG